jgi:hypothetical protein
MVKKIFASLVLLAMLSISYSPVLAEELSDQTTTSTQSNTQVCTTDYTPVCGTDNKNYTNSCEANKANVDVSYTGTCKDVTVATNQVEDKKVINEVGTLIEIGSTDLPTTIIVRKKDTNVDYTINIFTNTLLGENKNKQVPLENWIPGDQIKVSGMYNTNTTQVDATVLINKSFNKDQNNGLNGWITKIDKENKQVSYLWNNKTEVAKYDDSTRFVIAGKNPATIDDLKINDRVRGRLIKKSGEIPTAKIVVVLRRGAELFMKIRTFVPKAELVRLDSTVVPTTIQVKIKKTPGLKAGDVNNLIGTEGALVTVNITEDTNLVRKYFGKTTLSEFSIGDDLHIVGRMNDDGTIDAKLVKNESIWKVYTQSQAGEILEINSAESYIIMNWTPIKHTPIHKLKKVLEGEDDDSTSGTVQAQSLSDDNAEAQEKEKEEQENKKEIKEKIFKREVIKQKIGEEVKQIIRQEKEFKNKIKTESKERLKEKIKKEKEEKVGKFTRTVKQKKVKIDRIKHPDITLDDLIDRLPAQKIKVMINSQTKIIIGSNENGTIADLKVGDKIRGRGTKSGDGSVVADKIMVVNSIPEIEDDLTESIDNINEIVETTTTQEDIVANTDSTESTKTETELELDDDNDIVEIEETEDEDDDND